MLVYASLRTAGTYTLADVTGLENAHAIPFVIVSLSCVDTFIMLSVAVPDGSVPSGLAATFTNILSPSDPLALVVV